MNKTCKRSKKHKWGPGKFKQYCTRKDCLALRIVAENRFPKIGEAKYDWVIFNEIDIKIP